MHRLRLFCFLCGCLACLTCGDREPRALTETEIKLVEADNRFAMKLFRDVNTDEADKNVFISPLSIALALGIAYNGAAGATQDSMRQTLELTDMSIDEVNEAYKGLIELLTDLDSDVDFKIANSIWYKEGDTLEQAFLDICETNFDAQAQALDFGDPASMDVINNWVSDHTDGKITEIMDHIDPQLVVLLLNAIYFKGAWTYRFDKNDTQDDYFTLPDGSQKSCEMMKQDGTFQYFGTADFQAIDLPYGDKYFSMTIFLPAPDKHIDSLIAQFNEQNWDQWLNNFAEEEVELHLPKFTLEYETELTEVLARLGMGIAFGDQADFSNMFKDINLPISEIKHKTYVQVDEEGTEAAAVTEVDYFLSGPAVMKINRPFFYIIRDSHSEIIQFIGKVVEPML